MGGQGEPHRHESLANDSAQILLLQAFLETTALVKVAS